MPNGSKLQFSINSVYQRQFNQSLMIFFPRWSDGSAADFFFWQTGEPNNYDGNEQCVIMKSENGNFMCKLAKRQVFLHIKFCNKKKSN